MVQVRAGKAPGVVAVVEWVRVPVADGWEDLAPERVGNVFARNAGRHSRMSVVFPVCRSIALIVVCR